MSLIVSILFIFEFLLFVNFFYISLKKEGLSFKLGITFGVLYFIYIPVFMMIFTGILVLPKVDFGATSIGDVVLNQNIGTSFILILFLFSIITYLYLPKVRVNSPTFEKQNEIVNKWKTPLFSYIFLVFIIFIGSGMLEGGNWYGNRHDFMQNGGSLVVLMTFLMTASKVLFISILIEYWKKEKTKKMFFIIFFFIVFDMILTGNRIYTFISFAIMFLLYFKNHIISVIKYSILGIPTLYFTGYFASIFRHMRGPLFENGIPTFEHFAKVFKYAVNHEPPDIYNFFSGISESVNVNVIYGVFNRYNEYLYGATYLKTFLFPIPRSIWHSKPITITNIAGEFFGSASLVTTFIGEMFMNFSYWGIILLPLFMIVTEYLMKKLFIKFKSISNVLLFFLGLMIFRMPFSDTILVFVFVFLLLRLSLLKFKVKNQSINQLLEN